MDGSDIKAPVQRRQYVDAMSMAAYRHRCRREYENQGAYSMNRRLRITTQAIPADEARQEAMKPLRLTPASAALAAAGALGAAVILACSNPAVSTTPEASPQGTLTLVYGTNNRIQVTRGSRLKVPPTLTPRAAKVKYSTEGAPDWLNIHPDLGVISADARRIQGAFSSADPSGVRQDFSFRILAAGTKGAHAKQSVTANLVLTVRSVSLPAMSYAAKSVNRLGNAGERRIWVGLSGGLPASQADYAFEPPSSKPAWLSVGDTGIISGTVPTNGISTTYTVKVTGKGIYAGETGNVTFTLDVSGGDFDTLSAAGNSEPQAIWSDGNTMWVADGRDDKIYAYSMSTKERDSAKDFNNLSAAGNTGHGALWSDGTTMWVADFESDKIYAYSMSTKERDSVKDFDTLYAAGNRRSTGLWSDGTTMWVADVWSDKIYAYSMSTKERDSAKDFDTLSAAGNINSSGIWSDGTTMWVPDGIDDKIYAYSMSTKERDSAKDFDTLSAAGNTHPSGIWSDGTTMWVSAYWGSKIYAYSLSTKARTP